MKRRTNRHLRKRMSKPAARKRQLIRKEARKRTKYPMRMVCIHSVGLRQAQKRGV